MYFLSCLLLIFDQFMMGRIYSGILANATDSLPNKWHSHFLHCIDYLRQAIMCSADLALEIHGPDDADDLGPLDGGWNGHHGKYGPQERTHVRRLTLPQFAKITPRSLNT